MIPGIWLNLVGYVRDVGTFLQDQIIYDKVTTKVTLAHCGRSHRQPRLG